jgi:hypothetical protein
MPTDEEIHIAFEKGEAAVRGLFRAGAVQVEELARQLAKARGSAEDDRPCTSLDP